ncbi:hypothetical protein CDAR_570441 [Caerostris darwini]|uniref:Uncharacterized protein n=1 Tax=Caerostris darwini TaxID=1538125 RepID=A0AAV4THN5_9ARAC|nr:hypothetical protein CDAR_570441 [Caerostris darwini]
MKPGDYNKSIELAQYNLHEIPADRNFSASVLFTDGAAFSLDVVMNVHSVTGQKKTHMQHLGWNCVYCKPVQHLKYVGLSKLTLSTLFCTAAGEESTDLLSEAGESTSRRDPPNNPSGGKLVATLVRYGSVKVMNRPAFLEMRPFWLLKGRKRPFEK